MPGVSRLLGWMAWSSFCKSVDLPTWRRSGRNPPCPHMQVSGSGAAARALGHAGRGGLPGAGAAGAQGRGPWGAGLVEGG